MNKSKIKKDFCSRLHSPEGIVQLFDYLPDIFFFMKNREERFVMANQLFVEKCGAVKESDIIGKTDFDFFPHDRASKYVKDDQYVMRTGNKIVNETELGPEPDGTVNWFLVTKIPLYSHEGDIIGVAGIARDIRRAGFALRPFDEMSGVIEYISANFHRKITVNQLAAIANLSTSHFERKFKELFKMPPGEYILNTRIQAVCQALTGSDKTISSIAQMTGFFDHSHLTRQFVRIVGMTPREYRRKH